MVKITYVFLIFLTLGLNTNLIAQIDTSNLIVRFDDNVYLYRKNFTNEIDFDGSSLVSQFIVFNRVSKNLNFIDYPLEVYANKQFRYVNMEQLNLSLREMKIINNWKVEDYEKRKNDAIVLDSLLNQKQELKKQYQKSIDSLESEFRRKSLTQKDIDDSISLMKEYKYIKSQGLGIYFDWNEEKLLTVLSQSFHFEVYNYFTKGIKYIYITLGAYNRVNDIIARKQVKIVGPIRSNSRGNALFEDVFLSNVFEYAMLHEVKVQFFDGTFKIFNKTNAEKLRMSINLQNYLYDN